MADSKVIVVTGISGSGSKDFCSRYGAETKKNVKVYQTGDLIYYLSQNYPKNPPRPRENILNRPQHELEIIQNEAFGRIRDDIEANRGRYDRFIIDTHTQFYWNGCFLQAYSWKHLHDINPDIFVTLINQPNNIKERQMQTTDGRKQNHDYGDLELWQNAEVNMTETLASVIGKPSYTLPSTQSPLAVESLLDNCFLIYLQMPITECTPEQNDEITTFKKMLVDMGKEIYGLPVPIIDPRENDMYVGPYKDARERNISRQQTNHRDINWFIQNATDLIAYYPKGSHISVGVSVETIVGHFAGKDAFVVYPRQEASPFFDLSFGWYNNPEKFLTDFKPHMEQRLKEYDRKAIEKSKLEWRI